MRKFIDMITEAMVAPENPQLGAGKPLSVSAAPEYFYHGTNPVAAAAIIYDGRIKADHPIDDDDLGAVVCVSSDFDMGNNFATEFVRSNSNHSVGVVFEIDPVAVISSMKTVPYHAETAGAFEFEYRVQGDIPMSMVNQVMIVGDDAALLGESYFEEMWEENQNSAHRIFHNDYDYFLEAMQGLLEAVK